jgi:hypothetical protein
MIPHRKRFRASLQRFLFLAFIFAGTHVRGYSPPPFSPVVPGLDYLHVTETNHPWSIHIARLDRSRGDFEVLSALTRGKMVGLSSVAAQAKALSPDLGKPLVAINGDFFVIAKGPYQGDPLGLEIARGELISAPNGASFWVEPKGKFGLGDINSRFTVSWPHAEKLRFGLNEECKSNGIVLYTPSFGPSTRTTNGTEFVLERVGNKDWLPLQAGKTYSARVREVRGTNVDTPLASDIAVLSIGPKQLAKFATVQTGTVLSLSTATSVDVSHAQSAIGGRPILMEHGREGQWPVTGTNTLPRHPRTAVGWNKKYIFFVVVDGRQKELSMGMTCVELAHFFKNLGCTDAINLDGGGSTTFWLDGKIMNSPSDKRERSVANCLFIVEHNTSPPPAGGAAPPAN